MENESPSEVTTNLYSQPSTSAIPTNDRRKGVPAFDACMASSRCPKWRASNLPKATIPPKILDQVEKSDRVCMRCNISQHKSILYGQPV